MSKNTTDAVDGILSNVRSKPDRDGVEYDRRMCDRWQKYGHDRIYFENDDRREYDGYVNLDTGAVEGQTPIDSVVVEDGRVNYQLASGRTVVSRPQ